MSYILDALKKSEQERKQGEVPGLDSFQDHPAPPRSTSRILLYMLAGLFLATTLAISLWLFFRPLPSPPAAEVISNNTPTVSSKIDQPQQLESATKPIEIAAEIDRSNQAAITETETPPPALAQPTLEAETSLDTIEPSPSPATDVGGNEPLLADDRHNTDPAQPEPVSFSNLPPDIRNALPELVISAHYYSSRPSSRMASINGRVMRQGQTVTSGLILHEITREGVILSFHDYHFSLEVFNR